MAVLLAVAGICLLGAERVEAQLVNPDFDSDDLGWAPYNSAFATVVWDGSTGDPSPGSVLVESTSPPATTLAAGYSQCVAAGAEGERIVASAQVLADTRAGDHCYLDVYFFDCEACLCASINLGSEATLDGTTGWQSVTDQDMAPAGTASTEVTFGATLIGSGAVFEPTLCRFDTVRLAFSIFLDDFETGDACTWSQTAGWNVKCI